MTSGWNSGLAIAHERFWADFAPFRAHPFKAPDSLSVNVGTIPLGQAIDEFGNAAGPVTLPLSIVPQHGLICGTTGTGKTYCVVQLIGNVVLQKKPVWVFEKEKKTEIARYLLPLLGTDKLLIYDVDTFRRNPLEGKSWRQVIARFSGILRETYLRDGSLNLFSSILKSLFESKGQPTLADIRDALENMRFPAVSRRAQYKESLINRIGSLIDLVPAYNCLHGFPLEELLTRNCVFDLSSLDAEKYGFFVKEILSAISQILEAAQGGDLRLMVVIDEIHRLDSREMMNRNDIGEPFIRSSARTMRRDAIGLWFLDQLPSLVPNQLIGLANTKICLRISSGACAETIARAISLSREQQEFLPKLPDRHAVIYSSAFQQVDPFLVELPFLELAKASETEIAEAKAISANQFSWTPMEATVSVTQHKTDNAHVKVRHVERNEEHLLLEDKKSDVPIGFSGLAKQEFDYLEAIALKAFTPATDRDKELGISLSVGSTRRKKLSDIGLIKSHRLQIVSHGGMTTLVEVTDQGWDLLKKYKSKVRQPPGRGSFIHKFWQDTVAAHVRESLPDATISIEDGDGKAVDVLMRNGTETIGIEISISTKPEDELRNLINDFNFCDRVIVLAETKEHLAEIMKLAESEFGEVDRKKITTAVLSEFINSPLAQGATLT